MKFQRFFLGTLGAMLVVMAPNYGYAAGVSPLDPPQIEQDPIHLTFEVKTFESPAMGTQRRYGLVLPPGYNQNPQQRYPVVVLLHGGHGNERDYQDKADLTSVLHDLYRNRTLPPAIVITPDGNDKRGTSPFRDPQYYDGKHGKVATLIGSDLVQEIKSHYRTLDGPQFWAIGGLSSGGWGALNIGLRYTDQFSLFFSHSGYFIDPNDDANSPLHLVAQLPRQTQARLRIYLDAGAHDKHFLRSTREFHQVLNQLKIANQFNEFAGGHGVTGPDSGWHYWHKHLTDSLSYVGAQFGHPVKEAGK